MEHVAEVTESAALAAVSSPVVAYAPLSSDERAKLSPMQRSTVDLIHAAFHRKSDDGGGFLLGDGTGVGKTRTIAGAVVAEMADATAHEEPRCLDVLWVVPKCTLVADAKRELATVVGGGLFKYEELGVGDVNDNAARIACYFTTYAALRGGMAWSKWADRIRVRGGSVVIVYDEAHIAASEASAAYRACNGIQTRLPHANVLYATATVAQDLKGLALMGERLGLWGPEQHFLTASSLAHFLGRVPAGVLQLIPIQLKQMGVYVARRLEQAGIHTETVVATTTPAQRRLYDECTVRWNETRRPDVTSSSSSSDDEEEDDGTTTMAAVPPRGFSQDRFRFFEHLLVSLKIDTALDLVRDALAEGRSAVIAVQATGAASMQRRRRKAARCEAESGPRSVFEELMMKHGVRTEGLPGLPSLDTIDRLIHELGGGESVAEITGRTTRPSLSSSSHEPVPKAAQEIAAFQEGRKRVAIISQAGSTGIGLGGEGRFHLVLETPWTAHRFIQQCGRTHRAGQGREVPPRFTMLVSDIPAERRHVGRLHRRMECASMMTQGEAIDDGDGPVAGSLLRGLDVGSATRPAMEAYAMEMVFKRLHARAGRPTLQRLPPLPLRDAQRRFMRSRRMRAAPAECNLLARDACSRRDKVQLFQALQSLLAHREPASPEQEGAYRRSCCQLLGLVYTTYRAARSWASPGWSQAGHGMYPRHKRRAAMQLLLAHQRLGDGGGLLGRLPRDAMLKVLAMVMEEEQLPHTERPIPELLIRRTPHQFLCDCVTMPVPLQRQLVQSLEMHRRAEEDEDDAGRAVVAQRCSLQSVDEFVGRRALAAGGKAWAREMAHMTVFHTLERNWTGRDDQQQQLRWLRVEVEPSRRYDETAVPKEIVTRGGQLYEVRRSAGTVSLTRPARDAAGFVFSATDWERRVASLYIDASSCCAERWATLVRAENRRRSAIAKRLSGRHALVCTNLLEAVEGLWRRQCRLADAPPLDVGMLILPGKLVGVVVSS